MNTHLYKIKHFNNTLDLFSSEGKLYSSKWFLDFGKFGSEMFDSEDKIIYRITKQFQFWKWKMVFTIKNSHDVLTELISQNNRKTIYSIDIDEVTYETKIHFKKKISILKNGDKIAEIDTSFLEKEYKDTIKLQLLDKLDLPVCFLLFSCLKIGETEQDSKRIMPSQKQLEPNDEPWS
ncbi:hypothetical protein [Polaribacter atrinae]|uniref:Uncharacterized protein n=1 Tax=Polaribacter atrinae TaxID=1333662 RepID=A0A176TCV0_9FLAO|nr:hypothetical protein [Polaribacter atrinae]OAD45717.1 hypothetical protein LPB303_05370 [Polaribacter atrinae]